jgi:hypothetical protein
MNAIKAVITCMCTDLSTLLSSKRRSKMSFLSMPSPQHSNVHAQKVMSNAALKCLQMKFLLALDHSFKCADGASNQI